MQGLMDTYNSVSLQDPCTEEIVSDNYYLTDQDYSELGTYDKNLYVWAKSDVIYIANYGNLNNPWYHCYINVYYANITLNNIDKIAKTPVNEKDWNSLKGQAYFLRARNFLTVASIFSLAYDRSSASSDLGIPLRLDPDINKPSKRASVQETYDQIIDDLKKAIPLLPITPLHVLRSSRPAAYGLLARTYLYMREYDSCFRYVNLGLQLKSELLDYNRLSKDAPYPFTDFPFDANPEIIMENKFIPGPIMFHALMDTLLYNSYEDNDLRKSCYFQENGDNIYKFTGSYSGDYGLWDGIATDELYLMRAECYARMGKTDLALQDLNTLMIKRWKQGTFHPFTAATSDAALKIILQERRKELAMRNIRWMDIKRLNKEGADILLERIIDGQTYTLPPNDLRSALAVPEDIVNLFGITQNPR
jgi:hypothetical protein